MYHLPEALILKEALGKEDQGNSFSPRCRKIHWFFRTTVASLKKKTNQNQVGHFSCRCKIKQGSSCRGRYPPGFQPFQRLSCCEASRGKKRGRNWREEGHIRLGFRAAPGSGLCQLFPQLDLGAYPAQVSIHRRWVVQVLNLAQTPAVPFLWIARTEASLLERKNLICHQPVIHR